MIKMFLCSYFAEVSNLLTDFSGERLHGKSVAFIPTAGNVERVNFFIETAKKAFEKLGVTIDELDITKLSKEELATSIVHSDYIYVSGGNTFYLLQELKRCNMDTVIIEQVKSGKPYIGESAGAIIMASNIEYMKTVNFDPVKAPDLNDFLGLGLIDFYIVPHYGEFPFKKKDEEVIKLYEEKLKLVAINNKQAVYVYDNMYEMHRI